MNKGKSGKPRRIGGFVHRVFSGLLLGANLATLLLFWLCCLSTTVSPMVSGRMAVIGLSFPLFLLLNLLFIPLWLLVRWRWTWIPVVGMSLMGGYILDYYPVNPIQKDNPEGVNIVSWNVKGFADAGGQMDSVLSMFRAWDADVVCFQEFFPGANRNRMDSLAKAMGMECYAERSRCVYSRYPILEGVRLDMPTNLENGAVAVKMLLDSDTVWVVNCHLESNSINDEDRSEGREAILSGERRKLLSETWQIWNKLATSSRMRSRQVDAITCFLDSLGTSRSVLLMGDLNDTPISYTYQQIDKRLKSAYREAGRGLGVSYNERHFTIRIDHLFHSADWQTERVDIPQDCFYSDHNPLLVTLSRGEKE
ncbi:MAG: endonuclease/exonuclease/phosphatase family protein [Prevotellaceae bacterium]|nr:endonuclease/exonuclease/phosphatase family protein [Prevotellaceae bacterium]